jgi:hypothetical protein
MHLSGSAAVTFVSISIAVIVLLWAVPLVLDLWMTDRRRREERPLVEHLLKAATARGSDLTTRELTTLAGLLKTPPRGIQGLTRSLVALSIISLVGLTLAATIVSDATDSSDLRKTVVSSLLTVLATVSGFYFGSRVAQSSAEQARTDTTPGDGAPRSPAAALPNVSSVSPSSGSAAGGETLTIRGSGFTDATAVYIGQHPSPQLNVTSDQELTVVTPPGNTGPTVIAVETPRGRSPQSGSATFTYN